MPGLGSGHATVRRQGDQRPERAAGRISVVGSGRPSRVPQRYPGLAPGAIRPTILHRSLQAHMRARVGWPPRGRSLAFAGVRGPPAPAEAVHAPRGRNRAPANEQRTQPASRMRLWAVLFRWHARGWAAAAFISGLSRIVGMRGGGAAAAPWSLSVQVIFFLQKLVIYRSAVENLMRTTNTVALGPEPTGAPGRGNAVPEHPVSRLAQYIGAVCRNVLLPHTGAGADFSAPRRRHALPRGPGYQWLPSAT